MFGFFVFSVKFSFFFVVVETTTTTEKIDANGLFAYLFLFWLKKQKQNSKIESKWAKETISTESRINIYFFNFLSLNSNRNFPNKKKDR